MRETDDDQAKTPSSFTMPTQSTSFGRERLPTAQVNHLSDALCARRWQRHSDQNPC